MNIEIRLECKEFRVDGEFHKYCKPWTLDTIEILGFTISVLEIYLLSSVFRSRQRLQYAILVTISIADANGFIKDE